MFVFDWLLSVTTVYRCQDNLIVYSIKYNNTDVSIIFKAFYVRKIKPSRCLADVYIHITWSSLNTNRRNLVYVSCVKHELTKCQ